MDSKSASNRLVKPPFLGGLTSQAFLDQFWQKRHLFVPNAFPELTHCLDPNDLAGFSLEENIESRILIEKGSGDWEVLQGPFQEESFESLPKLNWTLLVQAVDHYFPDFATLLDQFNFLPQWRIDDIMMSYAVTGGNVGPHYDYYDVFLIQISGQRHWKVGQHCDDKSALIDDLPVRILKEFQTIEDHIVNPGDVLYLPPGMAHHGVALDDDCITLSIGFRAPSYADLLSEYSHHLADKLQGQNRYHDQELRARTESDHHSGLITDNDVARVKHQLLKHFSDEANIKRWMAEYLSLPKYEESNTVAVDLLEQEIVSMIEEGIPLHRDESTRLSLIEEDDTLALFLNGAEINIQKNHPDFIHLLSAARIINPEQLITFTKHSEELSLLKSLINQGFFYFPQHD